MLEYILLECGMLFVLATGISPCFLTACRDMVQPATDPKTSRGVDDVIGNVCIFRHALALDEPRPNYFIPKNDAVDSIADVKEVWFSGTQKDL